MKVTELETWADSKSCSPHRNGESCEHDACAVNDEALDLIRSLRRVDTHDSSGTSILGWIIDD